MPQCYADPSRESDPHALPNAADLLDKWGILPYCPRVAR